MEPFDFKNAFAVGNVEPMHFAVILLRLIIAAALGASIAYRGWRRFMPGRAPIRPDTAQAQTLIAVAGAIMVAVIGDNMARAFGLVGLGAFIRFRSGIKDPRDAAVMFVMIGIGMACGLGMVPIAVVATTFVGLILAIFDYVGHAHPRRTRVVLTADAPRSLDSRVRVAYPGGRFIELPDSAVAQGRLVFELDADETLDAGAVSDQLEKNGIKGLRSVTLESD